jgi:hypothetical protein
MDWVALDFPSIDATPGLRLIYSHLEKKFANPKAPKCFGFAIATWLTSDNDVKSAAAINQLSSA